MRNSKLFLACSALVLAVTAVFAARANRNRMVSVVTAETSNFYYFLVGGTAIFTTVGCPICPKAYLELTTGINGRVQFKERLLTVPLKFEALYYK